ncbi:MAG: WbqC family protein [Saprospiraceae bacterium]|nr:WbqC family protein [Saprospiraceae bacterium]
MQDIIHETQSFSPLSTYASYINADNIIIEKYENYQKKSLRNKYTILTSNGVHTLAIPLKKGKNNQMTISEVLISYDDNWVEEHLKTIRSSYSRSPFFENYFDDIEKIFRKQNDFLFDFNMECLMFLLKKIKLNHTVFTSENYQKTYDNLIDHRNIRNQSNGNNYRYTQVWSEKFDFIPNLSILDLLFCAGPESSLILKSISSQTNKYQENKYENYK